MLVSWRAGLLAALPKTPTKSWHIGLPTPWEATVINNSLISFPELVVEKEGTKSLCYDHFAVLSVEAIKEQQAQIEDLKSEVAELKSMLEEMKSMLLSSKD